MKAVLITLQSIDLEAPPIAPPSPHDRHRALAELDVHMLKAQQALAVWWHKAEQLAATRDDIRGAAARARMAEERLDQLRASREVLISGDRPEEEEGE